MSKSLCALLGVMLGALWGCAEVEVAEPPFDVASGPRFVRIDAGVIGETEAELDAATWVMVTEVTRAEWRAFGGAETLGGDLCGDDCPATAMTWGEAASHANARSDALGLEACYDLSLCHSATISVPFVPGQAVRERRALVCERAVAARERCEGFRLPTATEWRYLAQAGGADAGCAAEGCEQRGAAMVARWAARSHDAAGALWLPYPAGQLWEPNGFGLRGFADNASEWVEADAGGAEALRCGDAFVPRAMTERLGCDRVPATSYAATTGLRLVRRAE